MFFRRLFHKSASGEVGKHKRTMQKDDALDAKKAK